MKKIAILALSFVLTVCLFTACGGNTTDETTAPATTTTAAPTTAATKPTTKPTTAPTQPSSSGMLEDGTIDGNGDAGTNSGKVGRRG